MIVATRPEPTVRPPSRYLNSVFRCIFYTFYGWNLHIFIGFIWSIFICMITWHRFGTGMHLLTKLEVSILYKLDKSSGWLLSHNFKSPSFRLKCERKLKFLPYREWNCSYCFRDFKSCSIPSVDLDSSLNAAVIRC